MTERSFEIDDLAERIFHAEHFCTRDIHSPDPSEAASEVLTWMNLNDFDQAPIAKTGGNQIVLRSALLDAQPNHPVGELAIATPGEHWLEGAVSMQQALAALTERQWLLVRSGSELMGILTVQDLASPVVSAYLLARLLGLEHGLRRLYGSFTHQPIPDEPGSPGEADGWSLALLLNKVALSTSLREAIGHPSRRGFERATGGLVALRNHLAHGRSILAISSTLSTAMERIEKLERLATNVRQLLDDREHIWDAFAASEIVGLDSPNVVWAGGGATSLLFPSPVHVITAHNPYERVLSSSINSERHQLLGHYLELRCPGAQRMEVMGRSKCGQWQETSWAISGLERTEALAIAHRFQQRAIFELNETDMLVISTDGDVRRKVSRQN